MSKIEAKIQQLEHEAASFDAAYRTLRRERSLGCYTRAARKGEILANLLRNAADARQKASELRSQLPPGHPLYQAPPWQPTGWRSQRAA